MTILLNNRTKRLFEPNLHNHRFWSENQKKWFKWELDIESESGIRRGMEYPGLLTSCSNSLSTGCKSNGVSLYRRNGERYLAIAKTIFKRRA